MLLKFNYQNSFEIPIIKTLSCSVSFEVDNENELIDLAFKTLLYVELITGQKAGIIFVESQYKKRKKMFRLVCKCQTRKKSLIFS